MPALSKSVTTEKKKENTRTYALSCYPFIGYNKKDDVYHCLVCNKTTEGSTKGRAFLLKHIQIYHQDSIKQEENYTENKKECENHVCREIYGLFHRKLWCEFCEDLWKSKPNLYRAWPKPEGKINKNNRICQECGKSVNSLKVHMEMSRLTSKSCSSLVKTTQ